MNDDQRWRAVRTRDARFDDQFVYAVRSTGVFCRPSCPSRKPKRDNALFFADAPAARDAGFRPCRRCHPEAAKAPDPATELAQRVIALLIARTDGPPTLAELGVELGLSPHHLQRSFKQATGLSPRQYAEALRHGRLKAEFRNGEPVASALYGAGYGSSSRLYEKADSQLGMTPSSFAKGGRGAQITFAIADCPLGRLLVAATARGVCAVMLGNRDPDLEAELSGDFPAAEILRDDGVLADHVAHILEHLDGATPVPDLPLDVRATAFQWRVWECLRRIPPGQTMTYGEIAAVIGHPRAARAVGRACATNPVSLVVPCHRAVGADGSLTGYRWGVQRKRDLLAREGRR